jgi:hypothetical protein
VRPKLNARAVLLFAVALFMTTTCAAAVPPLARSADSKGTARVKVSERRLNVRAGSRVLVAGRLQAGGSTVSLQVGRRGRWITLDRARASASGRYVLRDRVRRPMSVPVRVKVRGAVAGTRSLGRLNVYRYANASWYGPGLFGRRLGCGGRLGYSQLGVAHKTLPCGTKITLRHGGRSIRVPVIDRGPYVGSREFDLTAATARRLHFRGHGSILSTR